MNLRETRSIWISFRHTELALNPPIPVYLIYQGINMNALVSLSNTRENLFIAHF